MDNIYMMNPPRDITQLTFFDMYTRLMMLAQAVFKWEGLPNGIDEKHIERFLFHEGRCMFFRDPMKGWMVAKCTDQGWLNYYDEPTHLTPAAANCDMMLSKPYEVGMECAVIFNNDYAFPTHRTISLYAARLADIQRTMDVNINAMKTPVIIKCNDKQRLSVENMYRQVDDYKVKIVVDKTMETDEIKVLNVAAPVVFDKLALEKSRMWNEVMTFLGVNNANMDKRERLVDDEVQANNEQIMLSAQMMLKARERAAETMSKLCGQKITVTTRDLRRFAEGESAGTEVLQ